MKENYATIRSREDHKIFKYCPECGKELGNSGQYSACSCGFVHYDNPKPLTATVITYQGGLVLVQRKFEPFIGSWCLPGGFIERCESPYEAAVRETLEETGLAVKALELWSAELVPRRSLNQIVLFYHATEVAGQLRPGGDALSAKAFCRDEIPTNMPFLLHRLMVERWKKVICSPVAIQSKDSDSSSH